MRSPSAARDADVSLSDPRGSELVARRDRADLLGWLGTAAPRHAAARAAPALSTEPSSTGSAGRRLGTAGTVLDTEGMLARPAAPTSACPPSWTVHDTRATTAVRPAPTSIGYGL